MSQDLTNAYKTLIETQDWATLLLFFIYSAFVWNLRESLARSPLGAHISGLAGVFLGFWLSRHSVDGQGTSIIISGGIIALGVSLVATSISLPKKPAFSARPPNAFDKLIDQQIAQFREEAELIRERHIAPRHKEMLVRKVQSKMMKLLFLRAKRDEQMDQD